MFEKFKCKSYGENYPAYPVGEWMFISKEVFTNELGDRYLKGWVDCPEQDFSERYQWLLLPEELEGCGYEL